MGKQKRIPALGINTLHSARFIPPTMQRYKKVKKNRIDVARYFLHSLLWQPLSERKRISINRFFQQLVFLSADKHILF